jgi:hypothetical protein
MQSRIDLDEAARVVARRIGDWRRRGINATAVTWRDVGVPWPYPLKVNRAEVIEADSLGVALHKGDQEGRLVLFRGGWADMEYWSGDRGDEPLLEAPGWNEPMTLTDFEILLERFAGLFG